MAKKPLYSEEIMLEAVERYAQANSNIIKLTELAKWANENIPGLEGVHDYDFTRKVTAKDPKTGKIKKSEKECFRRVKQINESRKMLDYKINSIINSSNLDDFFKLSRHAQTHMILDARNNFKTLQARLEKVQIENKILKTQKLKYENDLKQYEQFIKEINSEKKTIEKRMSHILKKISEYERAGKLKEIGIDNNSINLETLYNSLLNHYNTLPSIDVIISKTQDETDLSESKQSPEGDKSKTSSIKKKIMSELKS